MAIAEEIFMKFSYSYESNDNILERTLHKVEISGWNCTPLLVNLVLKWKNENNLTWVNFTQKTL